MIKQILIVLICFLEFCSLTRGEIHCISRTFRIHSFNERTFKRMDHFFENEWRSARFDFQRRRH